MSILKIILTILVIFSLLMAFTFYFRERPKRPVRAFAMLLVTIVLMWINYSIRISP